MRKSEIETYMDAFMEGFWQCYCVMFDLIDDDEAVNDLSEIKRMVSEIPPIVPKKSEPKELPKAEQPKEESKPEQPKADKPTHEQFVELFKEGKLPTEVAKELGVSPATAYNHMNKARQEGEL